VVSDGGGRVRATVEPTRGAVAVARFVTDLLGGEPRPEVDLASVNGQAGVVVRTQDRPAAVISSSVAGDAVTEVWIMLNPDRPRHGRPGEAPTFQSRLFRAVGRPPRPPGRRTLR